MARERANQAEPKTRKVYRIASVRVTIFAAWMFSWVLSSLLIAFARVGTHGIDPQDVTDSVLMLAGVFTPVLGCLTGFYFLANRDTVAHRRRTVGRDLAHVAFLITSVHLGFILFWVVRQTYLYDTSSPEYDAPSLPPNVQSFPERIGFCVRWAAVMSLIGTTPVIWLTEGSTGTLTDIQPDQAAPQGMGKRQNGDKKAKR
jgi:hypothetical protein